MLKEFRDFALRGSVVDLAIGVIIGAAFGAIVSSLVDDVFMPIIGLILSGVDFSNLFFVINNPSGEAVPSVAYAKEHGIATLNYGLFLNSIITFLIVALAIFMLVRAVNRMYKKPAEATPDTKPCPYCTMTVAIAATRCPNCTSQLVAA